MSKKRINKIKKTIHNLKLAIQKVMIWDEVKEYVRDELKAGEIVDITNIDTRKFYTCPEGFPSEYCSKQMGFNWKRNRFIFAINESGN